MTILTNTQAPSATEQDQSKIKEVQNQLDFALQSLEGIIVLYKNNKLLVEELKENKEGVNTSPWKNKNANNQNNIFSYIFSKPTSDIYEGTANYESKNYSNIFLEVEQKDSFNLIKQFLTQAFSNIDNFNINKFQSSITDINNILTTELLVDVNVFVTIINIVDEAIKNGQSSLYKGEKALGPYSQSEIAAFTFPLALTTIIENCRSIQGEINSLFVILDKLINTPQDILVRVALTNAGLTQSPTDPNVFNTLAIEEKDPWGIRFSYNKSISALNYANNTLDKTRSNSTLAPGESNQSQSFLENKSLLNNTVNSRRDFYFQLLPAIKSNLPVSGATDVPGAMPGIQFRIENNIVKHKIPGFAPVYQPMGVDSIKCTLVGMFTGHDGVDISAAYSTDINTGLLAPKTSLFSSPVNTNPTATPNSTTIDSSGLPIPSTNKSNTASDIAVLSEDAFRGAQDFYNEIVATGREIEVELNLRKGSGPNSQYDFSGGTPGPFRDETTGNPKFKGLIRRLDLYYTRRDRCWFILDLEVTDAGLIGKECINLTNIIEEATELFEAIEDAPIGLTKEELDKCFKKPIIYKYKGEKSNIALTVDEITGLSYEYNLDSNTLINDKVFPTSTRDTLNLLGTQYKNFKGGLNKNGNILSQIVSILNNATDTVQKNPENRDKNWAINKIKLNASSPFLTDRYARYDKNSANFFAVNSKNELKEVQLDTIFTTKQQIGTLKDITKHIDNDYLTFDGKIEESIKFFIDEYLSLITLKPTSCDNILKEKQTQQKTNKQENKGEEVETTIESANNNNKEGEESQFSNSPSINKVTTKENLEADIEAAKISIEKGELDLIFQEAVNEYITILTTNTKTTSYLSDELVNKIDKDTTSLQPINNAPIKINLKEKSGVLDNRYTTSTQIHVEIEYDVPNAFLFKNKHKIHPSFYRRQTNKVQMILKAYERNATKGTIVYKIDGIDIFPNGPSN